MGEEEGEVEVVEEQVKEGEEELVVEETPGEGEKWVGVKAEAQGVDMEVLQRTEQKDSKEVRTQ